MSFNPYLISYRKISLRWIIVLNVEAKIIEFLEESVREYFHKLRLGKSFLDRI